MDLIVSLNTEERLEQLELEASKHSSKQRNEFLVCLISLGRIEEAKKLLRQLASYLEGAVTSNYLKKLQSILLNGFVASSVPDDLDKSQLSRVRVWNAILEHELKGQWKQANVIYDSILSKDEVNQFAMRRRVAVAKGQGDLEKAVQLLALYLEVYQQDVEAWSELSTLYLRIGQMARYASGRNYPTVQECLTLASHALEECLMSRPLDYTFLLRYAEVNYELQSENSLQIAKNSYLRVLELVPRHLRALFGLLQVNRVIGSSSTSASSEDIERMVIRELEKHNPDQELKLN